jgi:hypothetical protein
LRMARRPLEEREGFVVWALVVVQGATS